MSVVVFAVGNPSRGDDALGPLLLAELERWQLPHVQLVGDFQLQVEHALDLDGHALALFIDAGTGTPAPFEFREARPQAGHPVSTHALAPEAVLQVFADIRGTPPPPAFVLCVRGEDFGLGNDLSATARHHLDAARTLLAERLADADADRWRELATTGNSVHRTPGGSAPENHIIPEKR